ncbi:nectin-1 isoform X6 [Arapaima gigas]
MRTGVVLSRSITNTPDAIEAETDLPPAHKPAPPPPKKKNTDFKCRLTSEDIQNCGHKDYDVQYAELDTSTLASSPCPRSSIHTGGDLVEYATIQPSLH